MSETVVLFGAGHMGSAIARGMARAGRRDLRVVDPAPQALAKLADLDIRTEAVCAELRPGDVVVLAMPPQAFPAFAAENRCARGHAGLVISVMAGVRTAAVQEALGAANVVRSIPNTPSEVFEGMTVYYRSPSVDEPLARRARDVFETFGRAIEVEDEALMDPATALCGGGPAFVAYYAHALQEFAVKAGLSSEAALAITVQLLRGAASLLATSGKPAMQLCREVMTPGGTTERGIRHFDDEGLGRTILAALSKSSARSRELGLGEAPSLANLGASR